jgi:outer membrane protein
VNQRVSLIFNVILGIAVAILYYLHFSSSKTTSGTNESNDSTAIIEEEVIVLDSLPDLGASNGAIAYIDIEELTSKYQYYKDGVSSLENDFKRKQSELLKKEQILQENASRYEKLAPSLSPEARQLREKDLMAEQQSIMEYKDRLEKDLSDKETNFSKEFLKKLDNYLKSLSKEKNYSYVFTYVKGGPSSIVYAKDSLNITNQVIKSLNDQYKKK